MARLHSDFGSSGGTGDVAALFELELVTCSKIDWRSFVDGIVSLLEAIFPIVGLPSPV